MRRSILAELADALLLASVEADPVPDGEAAEGIRVLESGSDEDRRDAVRVLWGTRTVNVRAAFSKTLASDPDPEVRRLCAMAAIVDPGSMPDAVRGALRDVDAGVRSAALRAVDAADSESRSVVPILLSDPDESVRALAKEWLHDHGISSRAPPPPPGLMARLKQAGVAFLSVPHQALTRFVAVSKEQVEELRARHRALRRMLEGDACRATYGGRQDGWFAVRANVFFDGAVPHLSGDSSAQDKSDRRDLLQTHVYVGNPSCSATGIRCDLEIRDSRAARGLTGGFVEVRISGTALRPCQLPVEVSPDGRLRVPLRESLSTPGPDEHVDDTEFEFRPGVVEIELFHRDWAGPTT